MVVLVIVFQFKEQDGTIVYTFDFGMFVHGSPECLAQGGEIIPDRPDNSAEEGKFSQLMRLKAAHLLAIFLLVYIGVEVTIGGKIFSYIPYDAI